MKHIHTTDHANGATRTIIEGQNLRWLVRDGEKVLQHSQMVQEFDRGGDVVDTFEQWVDVPVVGECDG